MGEGRDMARELSPDAPHHDVLEAFRDQLLICLLQRLADPQGNVYVPVKDVDATGSVVVAFSVQQFEPGKPQDGSVFRFKVTKKQ